MPIVENDELIPFATFHLKLSKVQREEQPDVGNLEVCGSDTNVHRNRMIS
jgi:hypothetical protein